MPFNPAKTLVNLRIDDSNDIISLGQARFLVESARQGCTSGCLPCHFQKRYLREIEPDVVESLLANEFQITLNPIQGGEEVVGYVDDEQPRVIPTGIYWEVLQLHDDDAPDETICKYIARAFGFDLSWADLDMIFAHYEESLPTDENGFAVFPDRIEQPRYGYRMESLPTTPVTPRLGRPRSSFSLPPPSYSPRPSWNGSDFRHPREVVASGNQLAPFFPHGSAPEPPTYVSSGPFVQPPVYEPQQLVSNERVESEGGVAGAEPEAQVLDAAYAWATPPLLGQSAPAVEPIPPAVPPRNPLRLQRDTRVLDLHVSARMTPASATPGQKYTFRNPPQRSLPTKEEVAEYLHRRANGPSAELQELMGDEMARIDQLFDSILTPGLIAFFEQPGASNPRTPPSVATGIASSALDDLRSLTFSRLPSPVPSSATLPEFPGPPAVTAEGLTPSSILGLSEDSNSDVPKGEEIEYEDEASFQMNVAQQQLLQSRGLTGEEIEQREAQARASLHQSRHNLEQILDRLRDHDEHADREPVATSPTASTYSTEGGVSIINPAFEAYLAEHLANQDPQLCSSTEVLAFEEDPPTPGYAPPQPRSPVLPPQRSAEPLPARPPTLPPLRSPLTPTTLRAARASAQRLHDATLCFLAESSEHECLLDEFIDEIEELAEDVAEFARVVRDLLSL